MKTIVAIFALFPLIVFGGVSTGPVGSGGVSTTQVTNIVNGVNAAAGVVTATNVIITTTNVGLHFTGFEATGANGNYFLQTTNQGYNHLGWALYTNSANVAVTVEYNQINDGNWYCQTNATLLNFTGDSPPITGWDDGGGGAAGTVSFTNVVITTTQSVVSVQNPLVSSSFPFALQNTNNILWVDQTATLPGIRGVQSRPFQSLSQAQAASRPGDSYFIFPGLYYVNYDWTPTNATIIAHGATLFFSFNEPTPVPSSSAICASGFIPVGSCSIYGGTFTNNTFFAASMISLNNTTNIYVSSTRFYGKAFWIQSSANSSTNIVADFDSCFVNTFDFQTAYLIGSSGTNASFSFKNCRFNVQPVTGFSGDTTYAGWANGYNALRFQNCRAFVNNCVFDFSHSPSTVVSNTCAIRYDTNSFVHVSGNACLLGSTNGTALIYLNGGGNLIEIDQDIPASQITGAFPGTTNSIGLKDTNGTTEVLYLYASTNSGTPTLYIHGSGVSQSVDSDAWAWMNGAVALTGINGLTNGTYTLGTVPAGKTFYPRTIILQPTTVTGLGTAPSVSIGKTAAAYTDVLGTTAMTALSSTTLNSVLSPIAGASVLNGGDVIKINVTAALATTAYTFKVIIVGTLL